MSFFPARAGKRGRGDSEVVTDGVASECEECRVHAACSAGAGNIEAESKHEAGNSGNGNDPPSSSSSSSASILQSNNTAADDNENDQEQAHTYRLMDSDGHCGHEAKRPSRSSSSSRGSSMAPLFFLGLIMLMATISATVQGWWRDLLHVGRPRNYVSPRTDLGVFGTRPSVNGVPVRYYVRDDDRSDDGSDDAETSPSTSINTDEDSFLLTMAQPFDDVDDDDLHQILDEEFTEPQRVLRALSSHEPALPKPLAQNYASLFDDPIDTASETAVFWHIPKAGGTAVENLLSVCLDLVIANEVGGTDHDPDRSSEELTIFSPWEVNGVPIRFVNVDTTSLDGLDRAKRLHLAESGLAGVMFTSYIHAASRIFSPSHQGRIFTILRHPVDRAVSMFYYLQDADWESTYSPDTKNWSLQEYAMSDKIDRDWMVRMLVGKPGGQITDDDLQVAKLFLQQKVLVGLIGKMDESVERFERYFGFADKNADENSEGRRQCLDDLLHDRPGSGSNRHDHPKVEPGSPDWRALEEANYYDMRLYEFAYALFEEQGMVMFAEEEEEGEGDE